MSGIFVKSRIRLPKNGPCGGNTKKQSREKSCAKGYDSIPHVIFLPFFNHYS